MEVGVEEVEVARYGFVDLIGAAFEVTMGVSC